MIIKTTVSYIRLEVDGKQITVQTEAAGLAQGQEPYFVAYANSTKNWDPPDNADPLSEEEVAKVLHVLQQDCQARNFPLEIE